MADFSADALKITLVIFIFSVYKAINKITGFSPPDGDDNKMERQ